jgi:hypothetical protein
MGNWSDEKGVKGEIVENLNDNFPLKRWELNEELMFAGLVNGSTLTFRFFLLTFSEALKTKFVLQLQYVLVEQFALC